jgi:predicted RNase H-like nuclease (RuvC/YqgF family)
MARDFDKKESEREEYIQHHSSTRHLNIRIAELESENADLKEQVADLKNKLEWLKKK